ncbi:MAG: response regulator [Akkermansiaceae bacterium]|nr:response regulator [Akkermansiaceae bacterium]
MLVVEDDPAISQFVVRGLREENYRVDLAEDGLAAERMCGDESYDVILADIRLPDLTGYDLNFFFSSLTNTALVRSLRTKNGTYGNEPWRPGSSIGMKRAFTGKAGVRPPSLNQVLPSTTARPGVTSWLACRAFTSLATRTNSVFPSAPTGLVAASISEILDTTVYSASGGVYVAGYGASRDNVSLLPSRLALRGIVVKVCRRLLTAVLETTAATACCTCSSKARDNDACHMPLLCAFPTRTGSEPMSEMSSSDYRSLAIPTCITCAAERVQRASVAAAVQRKYQISPHHTCWHADGQTPSERTTKETVRGTGASFARSRSRLRTSKHARTEFGIVAKGAAAVAYRTAARLHEDKISRFHSAGPRACRVHE